MKSVGLCFIAPVVLTEFARGARAQGAAPPDLTRATLETAFVTVKNAFDRRYRSINERAYASAEKFIGIPRNPRRITIGLEVRLK
jgi:hypothetical protein